jgi:hypothetical protein
VVIIRREMTKWEFMQQAWLNTIINRDAGTANYHAQLAGEYYDKMFVHKKQTPVPVPSPLDTYGAIEKT